MEPVKMNIFCCPWLRSSFSTNICVRPAVWQKRFFTDGLTVSSNCASNKLWWLAIIPNVSLVTTSYMYSIKRWILCFQAPRIIIINNVAESVNDAFSIPSYITYQSTAAAALTWHIGLEFMFTNYISFSHCSVAFLFWEGSERMQGLIFWLL